MTQTLLNPSERRWPRYWQALVHSLTQYPSFAAYFEPFIQWLLPQWSTTGYRTRVLTVRQELPDVYTLVLRPSRRWPGFQAGQFVQITAEKDGSRHGRFFSISSSPAYYARTGLIELTIRVQEQGRMTPWLRQQFAQGGYVSLSAAQGTFVLPADTREPLLLIAGGSGITPFRSMLQQLQLSGEQRHITLLYCARDARHVLFREALEQLPASLPNLQLVLMNNDEHGFISTGMIQRSCPDVATRQVLICGPAPMIALTRSLLPELGVASDRIHFEYFGAAPIDYPRSQDAALVSFQRSGITVDVASAQPRSLLQVAESSGLKPVSGCRIGVCHQCICQKKSGVVLNTLTGDYSDTGAGEIQLCVSVAASDLVLDL